MKQPVDVVVSQVWWADPGFCYWSFQFECGEGRRALGGPRHAPLEEMPFSGFLACEPEPSLDLPQPVVNW